MDPVGVTIEHSQQDAPIEAPVALGEWHEQTITPEQDTVFKFQAQDRNDTLATYEHRVQAISQTSPTNVPGLFVGACASAVPMWSDLQLAPEIAPSPNLSVEGLCNPNGFPIRIRVLTEPDARAMTLAPQACTAIESAPLSTTIRAQPLNQSLASSSHCTVDMSPPPDIRAEIFLACPR